MRKPRERFGDPLAGLLCRVGVGYLGIGVGLENRRSGFDSPHLHLVTSTAEAVRPGNLIIRLSACFYEEGRADEPARTKRARAC